jgi:Gpi18-like mannosyltransferase
MVIPAWIAGRQLGDLMTMHLQQAETFKQLTMNAPNLYQWLPDDYQLFGKFGILLAATSVFLFCLAVYKSVVELNEELIIKLSLLIVLMLPFFLPRMHERYFFTADVMAIIYAFYNPRRFLVPLVIGLVSLLSYFPFLFGKTVIGLSYLAFVMATMLLVVTIDTMRALYPTMEKNK